MFGDYRVVACTPGGRRQYLEILVPYILNSSVIDEYQIWLNTDNASDLAYMRQLAAAIPRIRAIEPTRPVSPPPLRGLSIDQFYVHCLDPGTIYIRFDDDVVYADPQLVERLLAFRVEHREYFLVLPLIINNPLCSFLLTVDGKLDPIFARRPHLRSDSMNIMRLYWGSQEFPRALHRFFLQLLETERTDWFRLVPCPSLINRLSINCIAWFGADLADAGGMPLGVDEEEWLGAVLPMRLRRCNGIAADIIAAHYAFFRQREALDMTDIMERYRAYAAKTNAEVYQAHPCIAYDRAQGVWELEQAFAALPGDAVCIPTVLARAPDCGCSPTAGFSAATKTKAFGGARAKRSAFCTMTARLRRGSSSLAASSTIRALLSAVPFSERRTKRIDGKAANTS